MKKIKIGLLAVFLMTAMSGCASTSTGPSPELCPASLTYQLPEDFQYEGQGALDLEAHAFRLDAEFRACLAAHLNIRSYCDGR